MKKQALELLDIAIVVITIGLVVSTSFPALYKARSEAINNSYEYMEDKNTGSKTKGLLINEYGAYDGTLSKLEVVLITQIQDENMPSPRKVTVNGLDVEIPFTYKEYSFEAGQNVWVMVKNDAIGSRYSLDYKFKTGSDGRLTDEYYAVNKMVTEE